MSTIRTSLAIIVPKDWHTYQMDVTRSLFDGDLDKEDYMTSQKGYISSGQPISLSNTATSSLKHLVCN